MLRNGLVLVAACWFAIVGIVELLAARLPGFEWGVLGVIALTPLAVMVLGGFLVANGVAMLRNEGKSLGNLLSLVAGVAIFALPVMAVLLVLTLKPLAIGLAALLFFLSSYFGVVFVVFLAYAIVYARMKPRTNPDAVVVLGSQIINGRVPPLLRSRLDKALEVYRRASPAPLMIPTGGQGPNESRPEGEAMAEYLISAGAGEADVLPECKAENTAQNLLFAAKLASSHGRSGPLLIVTNNYHVLRAALLSRKLGIDAEVLGSSTAPYFLPSAFLREFVAIIKEHRVLHALMCLPFVGLTAVLTFAVMSPPL